MTTPAIEMSGVCKRYPFFSLDDVSFRLETGQIMGFVGPNGAGKSTTIRILMALVEQEAGQVSVLGHRMPNDQASAKLGIGFVSDDMSLYPNASLEWHMDFVRSIFAGWDAAYAGILLKRFNLHREQRIGSLSHGERTKALLLLVLARRPRLLIMDEPTAGLDPVARHEVLAELMDVLQDDERSILFSSHNTLDVEQISDQITFIDRGRVVESNDKETFLERWRRLKLELPNGMALPEIPGVVEKEISGRVATVTTNDYQPATETLCRQAGANVHDVQRMTLEEIFVANVMNSRKERAE